MAVERIETERRVASMTIDGDVIIDALQAIDDEAHLLVWLYH
jgi:hypothetical protein